MNRGHVGGTKTERQGASDWYRDIEAANMQAVDDYAMAQAREEAAMFRTALAHEEAALVHDQIEAENLAKVEAEHAALEALTAAAKETTMFQPDTSGPSYRTTDAYDAFCAWDVDGTQWVLTDGTAYLIGYAPAIFRDGPMAQGWRLACPEELMARALED